MGSLATEPAGDPLMRKFAPFGAMMFSVFVVAFLGGTITAHYKIFPYPNIRDAVRTLRVLIDTYRFSDSLLLGKYIEPVPIPAGDAPSARWEILDPLVPRLPVIAFGGLNQYLELCPDQGCLAVAFDAEGKVTEAWPYRPVDIYAADITDGAYPHEFLIFDPITHVIPMGVQRYGDGDILVTFHASVTLPATGLIFPFAMGVTRVGPDGSPRWTRFDFSHHWLTPGSDGTTYVPALTVGDSSLSFTHGTEPIPKRHTLVCESGRPQLDIIQVIDGTGSVVEEIELVPIFLQSNWAGLLPETTDFCDPLHLNYIDEIRVDAGPGLAKGDLVLSLRNLSRFAIFDPETQEIKRIVSGGFVQQHAVHHLSGSKFLIFDNRGGDAMGPASRIVELDLATGVERRIFPNADTPEAFAQVFSDRAGYLDISPDRSRVLASFTYAGRAFEVDIASGRLLAVYDNLHDLSSVKDMPEEYRQSAWRFSIYGMSYLSQ